MVSFSCSAVNSINLVGGILTLVSPNYIIKLINYIILVTKNSHKICVSEGANVSNKKQKLFRFTENCPYFFETLTKRPVRFPKTIVVLRHF